MINLCCFGLQDQFDTIDLSDNEIVKLENFPLLNRLGTLIINNNRITRINPNIGGNILLYVRVVIKFRFFDTLFALLIKVWLYVCRVPTKAAHFSSYKQQACEFG